MAFAAKKISQVAAHMTIGFAIMFTLTGSFMFSGMAMMAEPVLNVFLLPFHEKAWTGVRARAGGKRRLAAAGEKLSQAGMHMVVSFTVIYWATGSVAFGGVAAVIEPVLNVVLMPMHDRLWDRLVKGGSSGRGTTNVTKMTIYGAISNKAGLHGMLTDRSAMA